MKFSSSVEEEFVILTISGGGSYKHFIKMATFPFEGAEQERVASKQ